MTGTNARTSGLHRRWVVLLAVVVLLSLLVRLSDKANTIYAARVIDDRAVALQVISGTGAWTRATAVTETDSTVTVTVSTIALPLPGFGDDVTWLAINLHDPIARRTLVDGSTNAAIPLSQIPQAFQPR